MERNTLQMTFLGMCSVFCNGIRFESILSNTAHKQLHTSVNPYRAHTHTHTHTHTLTHTHTTHTHTDTHTLTHTHTPDCVKSAPGTGGMERERLFLDPPPLFLKLCSPK